MDGRAKTGGTWATALHGLKWFTSNANSGLALAAARPTGAPPDSAGLGLYLVPSHLDDGRVNHYRIRRLKEQLGTRGLPTGEIELLGGNGYTRDYPAERLLRDAQVLTVWEGPANIQALELLRLLQPRYGGFAAHERRVTGVLDGVPATLDPLRAALDRRLGGDRRAFAVTTASAAAGPVYARKLLHRLAQSLAFALLVEDASARDGAGDPVPAATGRSYAELIDPVAVGGADRDAHAAVVDALAREAPPLR